MATSSRSSALPLQFRALPTPLRPVARAYLLGYASAVAPRLLTLILQHMSRTLRKQKPFSDFRDQRSFLESAARILRIGLEIHRFPTFCAALVGGTSVLLEPLGRILKEIGPNLPYTARLRITRWISTFIAAWFSLRLLQSGANRPGPSQKDEEKEDNHLKTATTPPRSPPLLAGRTLDLTLFSITRAIDVLVGEWWSLRRSRRQATGKWTKLEQLTSHLTDPAVFATSCAFIMWSWFYHPSALPPSYNKWITSAAAVDPRLIEALRRCHNGQLIYGKDTGQAPLLGAMCEDFGLPSVWGDPAKAVPFPCELVHMGKGRSCEVHAASRFLRSWKWSMYTYLPLALLLYLKNPKRKPLSTAVLSASRSSAFLGMFIALFYYGVCLGRTRIGPHIFGKHVDGAQKIDGGICVGTGCMLCGWSVLVETAARRKDMALFVAPRALATVVPRQYALEKQWRETAVFAASTAVVFTCVMENPGRVRGVLGGILNLTMRDIAYSKTV